MSFHPSQHWNLPLSITRSEAASNNVDAATGVLSPSTCIYLTSIFILFLLLSSGTLSHGIADPVAKCIVLGVERTSSKLLPWLVVCCKQTMIMIAGSGYLESVGIPERWCANSLRRWVIQLWSNAVFSTSIPLRIWRQPPQQTGRRQWHSFDPDKDGTSCLLVALVHCHVEPIQESGCTLQC